MHRKILLLLSLITVFEMSCAFVPRVTNQNDDADCEMLTKNLTLSVETMGHFSCGSNDIGPCLVAAGVIIPAATMVVSGSIVLAGNMIHWLEYHGTCDEGMISVGIDKLKHSLE